MRWAYVLSPSDKHDGYWQPRIVWADGMVQASGNRISSSFTLDQALETVDMWNVWAGNTDNVSTLITAMQRNATLTEQGYWESNPDTEGFWEGQAG